MSGVPEETGVLCDETEQVAGRTAAAIFRFGSDVLAEPARSPTTARDTAR